MHPHVRDADVYPTGFLADIGVEQSLPGGPGAAVDAEIAPGATVLGATGEAIGALAEVYFDNQTDQADWATVTVGRHRCVIPLSEARVDGDTLWVVVTAEQVHTAPHRDPATALTVEDKHDLDRHFGITAPQWQFAKSVPPRPRLHGEPSKPAARHGHATRARDRGPNSSRTRTGAVTLCPPEALRC